MSALYAGFIYAARRFPERPALNVGGEVLSYQQLRNASDIVAQFLTEVGAGERAGIIALASARAVPTYAALLGILKNGNGYLPISMYWPSRRIVDVLAQSGARGLIVPATDAEAIIGTLGLTKQTARYVSVTTSDQTKLAYFELNAARGGPAGRGIEYLIYTSGSTGKAKGVAVSAENTSALIGALAERFPLSPNDRCVQMADLTFDFSVGEMFPCWHAGAALHVPSRGQRLNPGSFIRNARITVWTSVPSQIRIMRRQKQLASGAYPDLRLSLFCGETLPIGLVRDWASAAPKSTIANLYGPTEATVFVMCHVLSRNANGQTEIPIGLPLGETRWKLDPVPEASENGGHEGELLLAGPQVVRGYWNSSRKSMAAFMSDVDGTTWYRTGDLVGYNPAFGFVFRGRVDFQVKMRGYRIELNEVARIVAESTATDAAEVLPILNEEGLCDCLVAFYEAPRVDEATLRARCAQRLHIDIVPRRFIALEDFPRTANGKTDRQVLSRLAAELLQTGEDIV